MACSAGPDNTKWDGETCISTANQTSCDSVNQTTCYYAGLQFSPFGWCGGQFVDKDSECGDFRIDMPGPLAELGVQAGDVVDAINGKKPTAKTILSFTQERPASAGACTRSTHDKRISLCLWR